MGSLLHRGRWADRRGRKTGRAGNAARRCWRAVAEALESRRLLSSNLISNPGFESQLTDWTASTTAAAFSIDTSDPHTGASDAMGVANSAAATNTVYQNLTGLLVPSQSYTLSGFIRSQDVHGGSGFDITLSYVNGSFGSLADGAIAGATIGQVTGTTPWTQYQATFTLPTKPADATSLIVSAQFANSTGIAWFDDLSLTGSASAVTDHLVFRQPPTNVAADATIWPAVTVAVEDPNGNIVTADSTSISIGVNSGPGGLAGTITQPAVNGVATFNNLALATAGSYTLAASDGTDTPVTSGNITSTTPANGFQTPSTVLVNENAAYTFSAATGDLIALVDAGASGTFSISVTATGGTFAFSTMTGLSVISGANGSAAVDVSGSLTALNTALSGSTFSPAGNMTGSASLAFSAHGPASFTASSTLGMIIGQSPAQVQRAYGFSQLYGQGYSGAGQTIAILGIDNDPHLLADIVAFDEQFSIGANPASAGFLSVIDQNGTVIIKQGTVVQSGGNNPDQTNQTDFEIDIDVEWAHAIAPSANIVVVEADASNPQIGVSGSDLAEAANQSPALAASLGLPSAAVVSSSYGIGQETFDETTFDSNFIEAGVTFVMAAGDTYNEVQWPSVSPDVVCVGGTVLTLGSTGDYLNEIVWNNGLGGTAFGASAGYEPIPSFQQGVSGISGSDRVMPDVAFAADGFYAYNTSQGWSDGFGTSFGAPQWSALFALADQVRASSLSSAQALDALYASPASDYNLDTGTTSVAYNAQWGLGTPRANVLVPGLTPRLSVSAPASATAGTPFSVTVDILDQSGNPLTSDDSSITLSVSSGPGSLGGTLTVAAHNGVATFSNLTLDEAGTYTLAASDAADSARVATSGGISVAPSAAGQLLISLASGTSVAAGATLPSVVVNIEDSFGDVIASDNSTVTLSLRTAGVLTGSTAVSAVSGVATFSTLAIDTAGAFTFAATDTTDGLAGSNPGTSVAINPAAPAQLVFAVSSASAAAGDTLAPSPVVDIEDTFGNIVTGDSAAVTISLTPTATVAGSTSVPATSGVATFSDVQIDTTGTYTLAAADVADHLSITGPSHSVTITPGTPAKLVFATEPTGVIAGHDISPAIVVKIKDAFGNLVNTDTDTVALVVVSGPGPLGGATSAGATGGVATFAGVQLTTAGNYTLAASDAADGLSGYNSTGFAVVPAAAASLAFTTQPTGGSINTALAAVVVSIEDSYGNLVSGDESNVSVSIASGHGTLTGTLTAAAVNGVATFANLLFSAAGTYTLAAADNADSLSGFLSPAFNIQSSAAQLSSGHLLVTGTSGDDVISLTTSGNDLIITMNLQEIGVFALPQITSIDVEAGAGNDFVSLGTGVPGSSVQGGPGDDTIMGGPGNDTLGGGAGNDSIAGGPGDDSIKGGAGDDTLAGGKGNDTLFGSLGNDLLRGGLGDDSLNGGAGANQLYGGQGNNTFYCVNGTDDQIFAGAATNDSLIYGTNDNYILESGAIPPENISVVA